MRLTRVTLVCLVLIISFGFYRLIVYLLDDVDAQTFQATEEVDGRYSPRDGQV